MWNLWGWQTANMMETSDHFHTEMVPFLFCIHFSDLHSQWYHKDHYCLTSVHFNNCPPIQRQVPHVSGHWSKGRQKSHVSTWLSQRKCAGVVASVSPLWQVSFWCFHRCWRETLGWFQQVVASWRCWAGQQSSASATSVLKNPDGILIIAPSACIQAFVSDGAQSSLVVPMTDWFHALLKVCRDSGAPVLQYLLIRYYVSLTASQGGPEQNVQLFHICAIGTARCNKGVTGKNRLTVPMSFQVGLYPFSFTAQFSRIKLLMHPVCFGKAWSNKPNRWYL